MGIYFNPSGRSYHQAVNSRIYIDKTPMIEILNTRLFTEEKCISVSHARRFGKSQAARMIDAYYSRGCDSRELFSKLKISESEDFEKHLNKYNVIHLDISSFADEYTDNLVSEIKRHIFNEFKEVYPNIDYTNSTASILKQVYDKTETDVEGKKEKYQFVIIIDEWDCVVRNLSDRQDIVHEYLQFLHSLFKSEESQEFLALGYITGILPIKKIRDESALNNFFEYTMVDSAELTPYFGFTTDEVDKLCEKYKIRLNQKKTRITPIKHGVDFLHCRYKFGRTGKIIKSGGRESVKRERRKLKKFRKKLDEGELDRKQIAEFYSSWRGFMQYFDSKILLKNTDKLYNKLFIEG